MSIAHRPQPMELDPMTVARAFKESGMFPDLQSEAQAVVKIVAGQEVGFGPMAAMQEFEATQKRLANSNDAAEGVRSFVEKRDGRFLGQ